jgi:NAD(P)-dependent dehydrogenase (short-subunit alcohol dehydrogenase family)
VFGTSRAVLDHAASSYEVLPLDVRSEASIQACVQTILQRTGRIDLLVNNAGFAQGGALEETSLEGRVLILARGLADFRPLASAEEGALAPIRWRS